MYNESVAEPERPFLSGAWVVPPISRSTFLKCIFSLKTWIEVEVLSPPPPILPPHPPGAGTARIGLLRNTAHRPFAHSLSLTCHALLQAVTSQWTDITAVIIFFLWQLRYCMCICVRYANFQNQPGPQCAGYQLESGAEQNLHTQKKKFPQSRTFYTPTKRMALFNLKHF